MGTVKKIGDHTIVKRNEKVLHNMVDDEVIMLLPGLNQYMSMNGTGSAIWELLNRTITVEELVRKLTIEYEIESIMCRKEVISFLNILLEKGLIEIFN